MKSESEISQSCPILSDPLDSSLPGSSIHGISQARVLEWGAIAFSDTEVLRTQKQDIILQIIDKSYFSLFEAQNYLKCFKYTLLKQKKQFKEIGLDWLLEGKAINEKVTQGGMLKERNWLKASFGIMHDSEQCE